jgi:hypothetical protein
MLAKGETVMKVHEFTIIASGLHSDANNVADILFAAGCNDAVITLQKSVLIIKFERTTKDFSAAVVSAVGDVLKTGAKVERIEPDHLVSLSDIARRIGMSRSAITNYHKGERGEGFPPPVARITSERPLYDWCEVAKWFYERGQTSRDEVERARVVKEANTVIATETRPDYFAQRMTKRFRELEMT